MKSTQVKVGDRIRFGDGEQEVVSVENMNNEKKPVIQSDYGFGQWVYNHCPNRAEIRDQVLAHHKIKGWQSCSFAMGVIYAIESKHTKSGRETVFIKECEAARSPLLQHKGKEDRE